MSLKKLPALLALLLLALAGCNTMEGAGDDIEELGDEIEDVTD